MLTTIYLTEKERVLYDALSPQFKAGWQITSEELDCYESVRQVRMRYAMIDFKTSPRLKVLADQMKAGEAIASLAAEIATLDEELANELLFAMGARGVNAMVQTLFGELRVDEDMEALSFLTTVRHKLLALNASALHS